MKKKEVGNDKEKKLETVDAAAEFVDVAAVAFGGASFGDAACGEELFYALRAAAARAARLMSDSR